MFGRGLLVMLLLNGTQGCSFYQIRKLLIFTASVATGYGQPPATHYDWTLSPHGSNVANFQLPEEAEARLVIERYCNKVTQALYTNECDPVGLPSDMERSNLTRFLASDLQELEARLRKHTNPTCKLAVLSLPSLRAMIETVAVAY